MKLLIDDDVFLENGEIANKISVFAEVRGHRLDFDYDGSAFSAWIAGRDAPTRDRWRTQWKAGPDRLLRTVLNFRVRVMASSNWAASPPELTPLDALQCVDEPVRVIVENDRNDKHFLSWFATPRERSQIEDCIGRKSLVIESRGGISEMRMHIAPISDNPSKCSFYLCISDSDALRPGHVPADVKALKDTCGSAIKLISLQRRAAENYIPRSVFDAWSARKPSQRRCREDKVSAFFGAYFSQPPQRRWHFNVRRGFAKDEKRTDFQERGSLFDCLPSEVETTLKNGFGDELRAEFANSTPSRVELEHDNSWKEINSIVREIIELTR